MLKKLNKNLNSINKIQSEGKDTVIETKNNIQGNSNRVDEAENHINELDHKEVKINQEEQ